MKPGSKGLQMFECNTILTIIILDLYLLNELNFFSCCICWLISLVCKPEHGWFSFFGSGALLWDLWGRPLFVQEGMTWCHHSAVHYIHVFNQTSDCDLLVKLVCFSHSVNCNQATEVILIIFLKMLEWLSPNNWLLLIIKVSCNT